ncbi:phosphoribosyltransferase [Hyalangium versicolor]|uniref:phosphoribosyltransferase n=1 Tax=Hyalangium versicolor TaxID=2861190 RepID=UPI001CCB706B|nr:phosphoribosyltransferase family protein [Hyalangium versicolor]
MRFRDRADAGRRLAAPLLSHRGHGTRVFGLNSGGVRVAYEVAHALGAPLELWVARTVDVPGVPLTRLGAVAEGDGFFLHADTVRSVAAPAAEMTAWMDAEAGEVALEAQRLRGAQVRMEAGTSTVVLVAEGIPAGDLQVYAALRGLRHQQPRRLVLAVPVAAAEELERLRLEADEVVCLQPIWALLSVDHAYDDLRSLPDLEVRQLLERAREFGPGRENWVPAQGGEWI